MSEVENVISSFEPEAPVEEIAAEITNKDQPDIQVESEAEVEEKAAETSEENIEEWDPKRAKNRISRQDKRIAKLTWQLHQAMQAQATTTAQTPPQPQQTKQISEDERPIESDYAGRYDEFVKAESVWAAKQAAKSFYEEQQKQQVEAAVQQQHVAQINHMASVADKAAEKFIADVPDAAAAKIAFEEISEEIPPQTLLALMSLGEQFPKAAYQLWKADKLEELAEANPMQAQILIASALATPFSKPVSKAPAPVRSAKGTVQSVAIPENPDELLRMIRKR